MRNHRSLSALARLSLAGLAVCLVSLGTQARAAEQSQTVEQTICNRLNVDDYQLIDLDLPPDGAESIVVPILLDGVEYTLVLDRHSVRSPDFRLLVPGPDGQMIEVAPPPVRTYQGGLAEAPDSRAAASLLNGQLEALIVSDGVQWGIQPLTDALPDANRVVHVVYRQSDVRPIDGVCGTDLLDPIEGQEQGLKRGSDTGGGYETRGTCPMTCEIAFDADVEFYQRNGSSVSATQADIENVLNAMEVIYDRDTDIVYDLTTTIVRTSEPDPYSSTDAGTLLNQFRTEWNTNQGSVHRDIAHLMTGKNIDGSVIGVAWLSVICNSSNGYGLSQSRFTTNMTNRVGLTAHEVGHNWSAQHCDGDGDCYIMCSGLGGCAGDVTRFGSRSINAITGYRDTRACLSQSGPAITQQPEPSQSVCEGDFVQLTVATDAVLPEYQWRIGTTDLVDDGSHIFGATSDTLTIFGATAADSASNYNCVVTDPVTSCTTTSDDAEIIVDTNVANILSQPQDASVTEGDPVVFSVSVENNILYDYQWRMNGSDLSDGGRFSGTQTTSLAILPAELGDDGAQFDCVITSQLGAQCSVTSDAATLTVTASGNDCPEDLDGDGTIGLGDLSILLANYNQSGMSAEDGDFDGDGDVDLADLSVLLAVYGQDCPTR